MANSRNNATIRNSRTQIRQIARIFSPGELNLRMILYYALIGVAAGLGAVVFLYTLEWAKFILLDVLAGREIPSPAGEQILSAQTKETARAFLVQFLPLSDISIGARRWIFFLLPSLGGLGSGILVYTLAPETEGHGTDAYINAFHNLKGIVRKRVPIVKSIASILTLATGGSGGREGPIAQIGSGFGSILARMAKLSERDRRKLLIAGTAGGLGAIFRAPLGAALTSTEVLYKEDFESDAIIPAIFSSVAAYTVFTSFFGHQPIFNHSSSFSFERPSELLFYLGLSVFCTVVGLSYIKFFYFTKNTLFGKLKIKRHFKPAIGGLGVGIIGWFCPEALGDGWGYIQAALDGEFVWRMFLYLALFKILATSLTIGSGGSAGLFGPTLFIGAMLGGAAGSLFHTYFPNIVQQPGAFVLVGMASFFAGVANAPMASLIMVCEMTGGYGLIAPLMLGNALNIIFLKRHSIYEKQVTNKFESPAHIGEMRIDLLKEMVVGKILRKKEVTCLSPETTSSELNHIIEKSDQMLFPVIEKDSGKYAGIVSVIKIREFMFEWASDTLFVVADVMDKPVSISEDMDLHMALTTLLQSHYHGIPVTNAHGKIIGMLRHSDVMTSYHDEIDRVFKDGNA